MKNFLRLSKTLLILLFWQPLSAQNTFELKPFWRKGESMRYELAKGKVEYWDKTETNRAETRQVLTLTVEDVDTEGYRLKATYDGAADFVPSELRNNAAVAKLIDKYKHFDVEYRVDAAGQFKNIVNIDALRAMYVELIGALATAPSPEAQETMARLKTHMTTDVYLVENVFQELKHIHTYLGQKFEDNRLETYNTEVANLLEENGKPIPAIASLRAKRTEGGQLCTVEHALTPDAATLKKLMTAYLRKMGGQDYAQAAEPNFQVLDNEQLIFAAKTAWINELRRTRTIVFDNEQQVEYIWLRILKNTF